jgi:hypothetical protein
VSIELLAKIIAFAIPLSFVSCGQPDILEDTKIDVMLEIDVQHSLHYMGYKPNPAKINSISLVSNEDFKCKKREANGYCPTKGTCYQGMVGTFYKRFIVINNGHYSKMNRFAKYELLLHEILHCAYNIGHSDKVGELMFAYSDNTISQKEFESMIKRAKVQYGFR